MPENERTSTRTGRIITPPDESSNLSQNVKEMSPRNWVDRYDDAVANMNASWATTAEERNTVEGLGKISRAILRTTIAIRESHHAHIVRSAERTYRGALENMKKNHVRVVLDENREDQRALFELIKKVGMDSTKNPYFILELQGEKPKKKGESRKRTESYVAYDPKIGKYVLYWKKREGLFRINNALGWEGLGASAYGRLHFKDKRSYEQNIAKRAGVLAQGMLSAEVVVRKDDRKVVTSDDRLRIFNRVVRPGGMKVPIGIAMVEMNEEGKLLVQGNPYLRATARERMRLQYNNTRRVNRESELKQGLNAIENRLTEQNYKAIEVGPVVSTELNGWFEARTTGDAVLRSQHASIVYRDSTGNDIIVYSYVDNGQRAWRVGVPATMAEHFGQDTIMQNLTRVPRTPAPVNTFNGLPAEDVPTDVFTVRDQNGLNRAIVQFRVNRGGSMFRLMHPSVREKEGIARTRMAGNLERSRVSNITNTELREWITNHHYEAHTVSSGNQVRLSEWANLVVASEHSNREIAISYRRGHSDVILHSAVTADGGRIWKVYTPEGESVNEARMMQIILQSDIQTIPGDPKTLPEFIVGAQNGVAPTDMVQVIIGRALNAAQVPVGSGIGIAVIPQNTSRTTAVVTAAPEPLRTTVENRSNFGAKDLIKWGKENKIKADVFTTEQTSRLNEWVDNMVDKEMQNRKVVIAYPLLDGTTTLIVSEIDSRGKRAWAILHPNVGAVDKEEVVGALFNQGGYEVGGALLMPVEAVPFRRMNSSGMPEFPDDLVQFTLYRNGSPPYNVFAVLRSTSGSGTKPVSLPASVTTQAHAEPEVASEPLEQPVVTGVAPWTVVSDARAERVPLFQDLRFDQVKSEDSTVPVSEGLGIFYANWIRSILDIQGINTTNVILEVIDAKGVEYRIYRDESGIFITSGITDGRMESSMLDALPPLTGINSSNKEFELRVQAPTQDARDFTLISVDNSKSDPVVTIVPDSQSQAGSVDVNSILAPSQSAVPSTPQDVDISLDNLRKQFDYKESVQEEPDLTSVVK